MRKTVAAIAQRTVRITGPIQVLMGIVLWIGRGSPALLIVHMAVGMAFVLGVAALAGAAAWAGLRWPYVLAALGWTVLLPVFGILQTRLLQGPSHWIVEVTHLLIALVAMVISARLARFSLHDASGPGGRSPSLAMELNA
jgi:hypothetical protein